MSNSDFKVASRLLEEVPDFAPVLLFLPPIFLSFKNFTVVDIRATIDDVYENEKHKIMVNIGQ
jgi:hypothetical protein